MAGDWLKIECSTPDKPEVFQIAERLQLDPDCVVGKLFRVWIWADQQTENGNAPSVTKMLLDRVAGTLGFADAMIETGWLRSTKSGFVFPNFERHNGRTAKNRAQTAKRVAKSKAKNGNARVTLDALPREEKRREENIHTPSNTQKNPKDSKKIAPARPLEVSEQTWKDFLELRKAKRAILTQTALERIRKEAEKARFTLEDALAMCLVRGWIGFSSAWVPTDSPQQKPLQRDERPEE